MAKYRIKLTQEKVIELTSIVKKGSHTTQAYKAAYVLLNCDEGEYSLGKSTHEQISKILKLACVQSTGLSKNALKAGLNTP